MITAFGICLDIIGAFFLAQSFIAKRLASIALETESGYGGPPNLLYVLGQISQQVEAWIGFVFLSVGFFLQLVGLVSQPQSRSVLWESTIFLLAGVVLTSICVALLARSLLIRWRRIKVARFLVQRAKGESRNSWVGSIGSTLMPWFRRQNAETDQAYAQRVRKQLGVES